MTATPGGGNPGAFAGGRPFQYNGEPYGFDPTVIPGLDRPVGWRVALPDGTKAWDKFGPGLTDWEAVGGGAAGAVLSVNGQVGNVVVPKLVAGIATGATQLSTLASASFSDGAQVKVQTVRAVFQLQQSALTVDGITVVNASGKAGWQWVRLQGGDMISAAQTTWSINPSTGNDENSGINDGNALKTRQELARRWWGQVIASATVRILANVPAGDKPIWNIYPTGRVIFAGVATSTIYTSTVTSYHQAASLTDSNQLVDNAVPGGSFTAAGAMADGVQFVAPNSSTYWWGAKDLGSHTLRISSPTLNGIASQNPTASEPYSAVTLPQIAGGATNETWLTLPILNNNIRYQDLFFSAVGTFLGFQFWRCAVASGANLFEGGLWSGSAVFSTLATNTVARPSTTQAAWQFCMFRDTGAFVAHIVTGGESIFNETTFQGCGLTPQSGSFCNVIGKMYAYDCTSNCLEALYWSTVLFQSGSTFVGAGNSGVLWSARQWSMIAYSAAAASVISASSTSATNGVSTGGVAVSVASLPINIGPGGQGIFQTDVAGSFT